MGCFHALYIFVLYITIFIILLSNTVACFPPFHDLDFLCELKSFEQQVLLKFNKHGIGRKLKFLKQSLVS